MSLSSLPGSRFLRFQAAALLGAVLGALLNLALVLALFDAFRIRQDLQIFRLVRRAMLAGGYEILGAAPLAVSYPLGHEPFELILFTAMAIVISAAASATAALLLWPLARREPLEKLATVALLGLGCMPAAWLPARRAALVLGLGDAGRYMVWLLEAGMLVTVAWWLLRSSGRRRRILRIGGSVSAALIAAAALVLLLHPGSGIPDVPREGEKPRSLPNVLLVSIDSLRADHLSCYGYRRPTSPAIDAVAAAGVRFATAVAPTSWTLPSHMTLLTGQGIFEHGVITDHQRLSLAATTLPEVLRGAGYRTFGVVGGPYLEARYGYAQGFEHYDDYTVVAESNEKSHRGVTSPRLVSLTLDWLKRWEGSGTPFFVFLHLWDVHHDYTPPPPYDMLFDPGYDGPITGENFAWGHEYDPPMDPEDLEHLQALYDGEIAFTDRHLARLLDWLRSRDLLERTLVVITADHGDEFFEHGERGHRNNLYDETLLVPLVFRYPAALPRGSVVSAPVRLQDVAPTILEIVGLGPVHGFGALSPDDPLAGRSLLPVQQLLPRPASGDLLGTSSFLRQPEAKVIVTAQGSMRLYDLREDPGEQVDLAPHERERARALAGQLLQHRERTEALRGTAALGTDDDADRKELLRSLGYVD